MSAAVNLYLSTLAAWLGIIVSVAVLVWVCAIGYALVAAWRAERRLDQLWADESPLTPSRRPFDQAREV